MTETKPDSTKEKCNRCKVPTNFLEIFVIKDRRVKLCSSCLSDLEKWLSNV